MNITTHHSLVFSIFSNILYYVIAFPILKLLLKIVYDLKIEGKENIRNIKDAVISVSNHVLPLDCAMVGLAYGTKSVYYTTQEQTFDILFVRYLVKFLRGIPIPKKIKDKKVFINVINESLKEGKSIHFYPEAEMTLREEKIKPFKNGAFDFAVENEVSIIPMIFCFREPNKFRKLFKKKKDVTLVILEPIYCHKSEDKNSKQIAIKIKEEVYEKMNNALRNEEEKLNENINKRKICLKNNA